MTPDRSTPTSEGRTLAPQRVADELRMEIIDGHWPVGARLPTHRELVERFEVSRFTIQQALGKLQEQGYIRSEQGRRGATVVSKVGGRRSADRPGSAALDLPTYIAEAFTAQDVTLDVFSFTAETLHKALDEPYLKIKRGELRPRSIALRLLLPSIDAHLALPRIVDDLADERPLARMRRRAQLYALGVVDRLEQLQGTGPDLVPSVSVQVRNVPITPMFKLYLLNGRDALFSYYPCVERSITFEEERLRTYDVVGLGATLLPMIPRGPDPEPLIPIFVEESQHWFDSLWTTIAQESTIFQE